MQDDFLNLVKQARKGNREAFASLYSEVYKELYRYAYLTLRSPQDAQDAVSDTIVDAFASIGKLKTPEAFKSWIFRILSKKCKKIIRSYYNTSDELDEKLAYGNEDYDEILDLHHSLSRLDDDERMIISLIIVSGYSSAEVGKILKMNSNTVRSKYSRALEKLRGYSKANSNT